MSFKENVILYYYLKMLLNKTLLTNRYSRTFLNEVTHRLMAFIQRVKVTVKQCFHRAMHLSVGAKMLGFPVFPTCAQAYLYSGVSDSCDPMDRNPPGSSVHGILQEEYWSGLLCPPARDRFDPGIEPRILHCRQILYSWAYVCNLKVIIIRQYLSKDSIHSTVFTQQLC